MRWFFFGSLLDRDVMQIVLDRPMHDMAIQPAVLHGFARYRVEQETFPALSPCADGVVEGILVDGLNDEDARRICFFEGDEFALQTLTVRCTEGREHPALVFTATNLIELSAELWELEQWQRHHKSLYLTMSRDWMQAYGRADYTELNRYWRRALGLEDVPEQ